MKLPNFRSFTTQAQTGVLLALVAVATVAALAYCAMHGYSSTDNVVPYNASEGLGQHRPNLVLLLTALTLLIAVGAGALGFNSLGQKRNEKQGLSWLSLAIATLCIPAALFFFFFWKVFSEAVITKA